MVVWSLGFNAFGALLLGFVGGRAALLGLPPVFCFLDGPCIHARYGAQMQSADSKDLGGRRRPFDAFAHGRKSPGCVTRVRALASLLPPDLPRPRHRRAHKARLHMAGLTSTLLEKPRLRRLLTLGYSL
jgi:hypothetical protein